MASIAERLQAARQAAVNASGFQTGVKTAAPTASTLQKPATAPAATPSKAGYSLGGRKSVSVLRKEDMIPQKTKETQVLFRCIKPNLNFVIAGLGKEAKRIHFQNQYLLTEDAEVIVYTRKNALHFGVEEIKQETKKSEQEIKETLESGRTQAAPQSSAPDLAKVTSQKPA